MHVLRGEDVSGELKDALEAIERDAARASSNTQDCCKCTGDVGVLHVGRAWTNTGASRAILMSSRGLRPASGRTIYRATRGAC